MNSDFPVSVVIPIYNGKDVIIRALDSVVRQTLPVDEVIIVDDGSTDNSSTLIQEYIDNNGFEFIKVISKRNGGVSSARNAGVLNAKNEFVAFLDCDDEWIETKLEEQSKYFFESDVVLVGGNHFSQKINRILFRPAKDVNDITINDLLFRNFFQPSTVVVRKKNVIDFGGFNEEQTHAEEGQFYYNLSKVGRLIHINKQLVIYDGGEKLGCGQSGLSGNIIAMEMGELRNIRYAYEKLGVGFFMFSFAIIFSILKFIKRYLRMRVLNG